MKKIILLFQLLIFLASLSAINAQTNINNYKYIIVSKQFSFQKSANQYQINELTKFLFTRAGFTVLDESESFPTDLAVNRCLALNGVVKDNSGLFKTKVTIELTDCTNKIVFSTNEGISSEKNYKKAYNEAIRIAFKKIEALNYQYAAETPRTNNPINKVVEPSTAAELPIVDAIKNETQKIEVEKTKVVDTIVQNKRVASDSDIKPTITGIYYTKKWGTVAISKNDTYFILAVGDEHLEIGQLFTTSNPTIFIVKWAAFKRPQLVNLKVDGNLQIDSETGMELATKISNN